MAESEEKLKNLFMRVNEQSEKAVIRITLYDNEAMGAH